MSQKRQTRGSKTGRPKVTSLTSERTKKMRARLCLIVGPTSSPTVFKHNNYVSNPSNDSKMESSTIINYRNATWLSSSSQCGSLHSSLLVLSHVVPSLASTRTAIRVRPPRLEATCTTWSKGRRRAQATVRAVTRPTSLPELRTARSYTGHPG